MGESWGVPLVPRDGLLEAGRVLLPFLFVSLSYNENYPEQSWPPRSCNVDLVLDAEDVGGSRLGSERLCPSLMLRLGLRWHEASGVRLLL